MIPRIATVGTSFSPLPCQAWHRYGATSAHRVEVEVGADGHANAPPSGAAAAAPPAGAHFASKHPGDNVSFGWDFRINSIKSMAVCLSSASN
jgi:hypothetical protein